MKEHNWTSFLLELGALACLVIVLFIYGHRIELLEDSLTELVMNKIRVECGCE